MYKIFKGLTVPAKPVKKSVSEITELMCKHQNPKPNLISERFKFNSHSRQPKEIILEYMAELHRLTEFCNYGEALEDVMQSVSLQCKSRANTTAVTQ